MTRNYIISYDLNGPVPTHAQMDKHIGDLATEYGRILETVWYIRSSLPMSQLAERINAKLSLNDRLMVVEAKDAWVRNLLVPTPNLRQAWAKAA